jgi:hypothetical protein
LVFCQRESEGSSTGVADRVAAKIHPLQDTILRHVNQLLRESGGLVRPHLLPVQIHGQS